MTEVCQHEDASNRVALLRRTLIWLHCNNVLSQTVLVTQCNIHRFPPFHPLPHAWAAGAGVAEVDEDDNLRQQERERGVAAEAAVRLEEVVRAERKRQRQHCYKREPGTDLEGGPLLVTTRRLNNILLETHRKN